MNEDKLNQKLMELMEETKKNQDIDGAFNTEKTKEDEAFDDAFNMILDYHEGYEVDDTLSPFYHED